MCVVSRATVLRAGIGEEYGGCLRPRDGLEEKGVEGGVSAFREEARATK